MKFWKQGVGALCIAATLCFLPTLALAETPAALSLSLEEAKAKAMENNSQIKLQEMAVDTAKNDQRIADKTAELLEDYYFKRGMMSADNPELGPKQAKIALDLANASLDYTKRSINLGVETAYYGVLQAQKNEEVMEASLARAKKQWDDTQAKYEVGVSAKLDVLSAESSYIEAQTDLNKAKDATKIAKMNLCQLLGIDLDTDITLKDSFDFTKEAAPDAAKLYETGKTSDLTTYSSYCNQELVRIVSEERMGQYPSNTYQHKQAKINLQDAEIKYQDALNALKINVSQVVMDLQTAEENYEALQRSKELASEAYRLAELRYNNGLATVADLLSAEATLKQAELGELSALYAYNMAKSKIAYGIFSGGAGM